MDFPKSKSFRAMAVRMKGNHGDCEEEEGAMVL